MNRSTPFLIKDVGALRTRIQSMESNTGNPDQRSKLWTLLKNCARSAPDQFPWFTPFVALMTQEEQDIANAKKILGDYIEKLEPMIFTSGIQFHFWCFAFPHAKWTIYFQWLVTLGAFTPDEEAYIRDKLINYQFTNFFFGMRTKPEPECVDNQTLSLCMSNVLVGHMFSEDESPSPIAKLMMEEGMRRLPGIMGSIPASGYTGEGSTYMDCVVGPSIPLIVEMIEEITGETDVFFKPFLPNEVTPETVLRMVSRDWMPGGLLLPWDHYGYKYGVRAPMAYAAMKSKQAVYMNILQKDAVWSYDVGTGWSYDDLVWTCIWWPEDGEAEGEQGYEWSDPHVGGAITAQNSDYYLMQMWDESEPVTPSRLHVNPNAVVLNAYGVPLTLDGFVNKSCSRFQFPDTWREVIQSVGEVTRYNYGDGCAGAHSVLLVDRWEGMRAMTKYEQAHALELNHKGGVISADVTPIYKEHFQDAVYVRRRSSAAADRFFVIEDQAKFEGAHQFTSRFVLRPSLVDLQNGAKLQTPEGITLHLINVLGNTTVNCEKIEGYIYGYPMDNETLFVDFDGDSGQRLFVAFMSRSFKPVTSVEEWQTVSDPSEQKGYEEILGALASSPDVVPFKLPAYMEKQLPIVKRWWYHKKIQKEKGKAWLQLPRGAHQLKCWINHQEMDVSEFKSNMLTPVVKLPEAMENLSKIEVVIRCDVPIDHFEGGGEGTIGVNGGVFVCYPCEEEKIVHTAFDGEHLEIKTNQAEYRWPYRLMEG